MSGSDRLQPPDFSRDVRCVLGLPFDALTVSQAEALIRRAIAARSRCFVSTPNLNFVVACLSDEQFRTSVLQSDLSLADGWPIVSIARAIGTALPQRVAGSTLFERLVESKGGPAISVYFFGGPEGAARVACERLNSRPRGVVCAGFDMPGFGSVEEMSSASCIDRLNSARPDFVVVALGARKGQAWIQRNLERIEAPVVSHLGAVVNFIAGSVSRAPRWLQKIGLEWLWRIKEEPALWRRYAGDGRALVSVLTTRVIPLALRQASTRWGGTSDVSYTPGTQRSTLALAGYLGRGNLQPLRAALTDHASARLAIAIDLRAVAWLDASAIALLSLLYGWQQKIGAGWEVLGASRAAQLALRGACAGYLLSPRVSRFDA